MKNFLQVNRALAAEKNFYLNLNQLLTKLSSRLKTDGTAEESGRLWERISNHTLITQLSPNNHPINLPAIRYVATLLVVLMVGFGQAWGDTELFSTSFSSWSDQTICADKDHAQQTVSDITFYSKVSSNNTKPVTISSGVMTWFDNNMETNGYYMGIPVTGINDGTITVTVTWVAVSGKKPKLSYQVKDGATTFSTSLGGSNSYVEGSSGGTETSFTIDNLTNVNNSAYVYLGRGGSNCTQITAITITTPAASCDAPTAVYVTQTDGSPDMIAGESFTLSAATSTGVAEGATYEWFRGSTPVGTNSATYTVASCTATDAGTYWCKITNPCSEDAHTTNVTGYGLKVWQVLLYNSSWNAYDLTSTGTKTGTLSRRLTPGTYYIKLTHNNGVDFGVNTGETISEITATTPSAWTLYGSQNNIKLTVTTAGYYTFDVDYTSANNPTLSVTFPSATISSCDKIYFCPSQNSIATGSAKFSIYFWNDTEESGWASCYLVDGTNYADDANYVAFAPSTTNGWKKMIVVRDDAYATNFDGIWNQSQDISYNGYDYIVGIGWSDSKFTNNVNSFYSSTTPAMGASSYATTVDGTTNASTNLTGATISYVSDDPSVATVNSSGVITGVAVGETTITASVGSCTVGSATVTVSRNTPTQYTVSGTTSICSGSNTNITLSGSETGASYQLKKGGVAEGDAKAGTGSSLTWSVSAAGTYTVSAVQTAKCTARDMSGSAVITVNTPVTASWSTTPADGVIGGSMTASVTTNYSDGLSWESSNTSVATVTSAGVISYKAAGTATITATVTGAGSYCSTASVNQSITVKCSVTYAANNGSASGSQTDGSSPYTTGSRVTVKDQGTLSLTNYQFVGWNTATNGSGTWYSPGANFAISANTTLNAQWRDISSPGCPGSAGGTLFSLSMGSSVTSSDLNLAKGETKNLPSYATITKGSAQFTNVSTSDNNKAVITDASTNQLKFAGNDAMLTLYLDCALEVGDVIAYTGDDEQLSFSILPFRGSKEVNIIASTTSQSYTVEDNGLVGPHIIYVWRKSDAGTTYMTGLTITRPADCTDPDAPTELTCSTAGVNSLAFSWTAASNASSYDVYLYSDEECTSPVTPTEGSPYNVSTTSATLTGLTASTTYYCKVQSKGNGTTYCEDGGTTDAEDAATTCTSITPTWSYFTTTVGKGITIRPTIGGNTGSGAVTYSSSNTSNITNNLYAETENTSATVTANVAANGNYCSGSVTSSSISVVADQTGLIKQSLNYGKQVAWGTPSAPATSGTYASDISSTTAIDKNGELAIGSKDDKAGNNDGMTVKITGMTAGNEAANSGNYMELGFTVADGKKLNVSAIYIPVQPVSNSTNNFKAVLSDDDDDTDDIVGTLTNAPDGKLFYIPFSSYGSVTGDVTLRIYAWGWTGGYRLGKSIVIDGETESTATLYDISTSATNGSIAVTVGGASASSAEEDATVTITATPSSGYSFSSWSVAKDDSGAPVSVTSSTTNPTTFTMPAEDVTVSATFSEITHTVSVAAGAHGTVSPSSVNGVGIATASGNITATPSTGYSFNGWTLPSGVTAASTYTASSNPIKINAIADDKTITATWTTVSYTISYTLNGGDDLVSPKTSYNIETDDYDLPTPTRSNYVFQGWYTDEDFTSDRVYTLAQGSTGNKNYYAKWGSDVEVNWTITKVSSNLYKGGTGYTVTAEIDDAAWDASGDKDDLVLSASDGVTLSNITKSINGSDKAQVEANFSVAGDVEGDKIYFTLSVPAAGDYSAIDDEKEVELDDCPGGSTTVTLGWFDTSQGNKKGSYPSTLNKWLYGYTSSTKTRDYAYTITTASTNNKGDDSGNCLKIYHGGTSVDIYADSTGTSGTPATFSNVTAISLDVKLNKSDGASNTITVKVGSTTVINAQSLSEATTSSFKTYSVSNLSNLSGAVQITNTGGTSTNNDIFVDNIAITYTDATGGVATSLAWSSSLADKATVNKNDVDADFQYYASPTPANAGGPISYTSSDESVATVSSNGTVHIVGDGTTTITASMPAYGCYSAATSITYLLVVANTCPDEPGTIVNNDGSTITGNKVSRGACETLTLKLTGHTGSTIAWKKDGETIVGATSSSYTVPAGDDYSGVYSATVTGTCILSSTNSITVTTAGSIDPTIFAKEFTVKSGRPFHYRLMQLNKGESVSVKSATSWTENTDFVITKDADNIVYISSMTYEGVSIETDETETITLTISNSCGGSADKEITIHKIEATAKLTVAWIATGDEKGKKACKASESTNTTLYEYLEDYYTMTARNCYWETREDSLVKEYSKYDLVILTDYPNSGTCPKGKSGKSNSYTNAIGQLIDYRPIMTFEAFVAGCPNWGIPTDPSNTKATQKSLTLLCNASDIFDDDTNKFAAGEDIAVTDAASGQALQGFPVASLPDFVFIGKITDSDTKEYIACCERQVNTSARTLIFGLNSALMSNLTDDGKLMVKGFADYLLLTDPASIPDCSVIFNGNGSDDSWYTTGNWEGGSLPNQYASVRIDAPCEVPNNASPAKAGRIKIHQGGLFTGSLTIKPAGRMIVEKAITRVEGSEYTVHKQTATSDVVIETSSTGQGALIFNNESARTQATVELYSKGCNDGSYKYQYFASPFTEISSSAFGDAYIYTHAENLTKEWTQCSGEDVYAFQGLALTADGDKATYEVAGELASTAKHTYNLTYTSSKAKKNGTNVVGNSWTAPIQITRIDDSDFDKPSNFEGTVYIYNAGRDAVQGTGASANADMSAGVWQAIPISTAKTSAWKGSRQIPAYQAFQLKVSAPVKFTVDYNKHVRQSATQGGDTLNAPLHAPARSAMRIEDVEVLRLCVTDINNEYHAHIYLCEGEDFTEGRDRGWEAQQVVGDGKAGKLYAIDDSRSYMMSIARQSLEGTPVGFIAGLNTEYIITFNETSGIYYLNDLETQTSTLIQEGESYQFTTPKGNHPNRFIISSIPFNAPQTTTGVTDLDAAAPKAQKILYNDKVYIIRGGKVYSIDGALVK